MKTPAVRNLSVSIRAHVKSLSPNDQPSGNNIWDFMRSARAKAEISIKFDGWLLVALVCTVPD